MIAALVARWCAARSLDDIRQAFAGTGVLWGEFQDFSPTGAGRPALLGGEPAIRDGRAAGDRALSDAGAAARFRRGAAPAAAPRAGSRRAQRCRAGASAGPSTAEIGRLHDNRHRRRPGRAIRGASPPSARQPSLSLCRSSTSNCRTRRAVRNFLAMSGARRRSPCASSQPASMSGGNSRIASAKARKISST